MLRLFIILLVSLPLIIVSGCTTREVVGGAALGAGAAGAAYEYNNKKSMDSLENDYQSGRISTEEYQRRKQEIENKSLIY